MHKPACLPREIEMYFLGWMKVGACVILNMSHNTYMKKKRVQRWEMLIKYETNRWFEHAFTIHSVKSKNSKITADSKFTIHCRQCQYVTSWTACSDETSVGAIDGLTLSLVSESQGRCHYENNFVFGLYAEAFVVYFECDDLQLCVRIMANTNSQQSIGQTKALKKNSHEIDQKINWIFTIVHSTVKWDELSIFFRCEKTLISRSEILYSM